MPRVIAVLNRVRRNATDILFAKFVAMRMAESPLFTSPPIPLAKFAADVEAAEAAQAFTLTRHAGAAATRDALVLQVWNELDTLRAYVQRLADANTDDPAVVIMSAGMDVKRSSGHGRDAFKVRKGSSPGILYLYAARAKRQAAYEWQFSIDGTTWTTAAYTVKASARITGLEVGKRYFFRYRALTGEGLGDFGQVLTGYT